MRVLFPWLAMVMLAGSATAQDAGKLAPLPGGPALLDRVAVPAAPAPAGAAPPTPSARPLP